MRLFKDAAMQRLRTANACLQHVDRKTEKEERHRERGAAGWGADKGVEERGEGPPSSNRSLLREPTKGTFPHTHHEQPANQRVE